MSLNRILYLRSFATNLRILALSFLPHYFLHPVGHSNTDCGKFTKPSVDQNGNPFQDFATFYPYYICEHLQPKTKLFHFVGTGNLILLILYTLYSKHNLLYSLLIGAIQAYTFAWVSHFTIEKNKPATFNYPFLSFLGDFKMFSECLQGEYVLWE